MPACHEVRHGKMPRHFAAPSRVFPTRRAVPAADGLRLRAARAGGSARRARGPRGGESGRPRALQSAGAAAGALSRRKAKSVIWLFMNGGPSQVDTWDYKPELAKRDGKELTGFDKNTGFFTDQVGPLMKSPFKFAQHGQSGTWVSEIFPEHWPSTSTTWRSSIPASPRRTTIRPPCSRSTRHEPDGLPVRRARG